MSVEPAIPYSAYEPILSMILIFLFPSLIVIFLFFTYARYATKQRQKEAEKKIEEQRLKEAEKKMEEQRLKEAEKKMEEMKEAGENEEINKEDGAS